MWQQNIQQGNLLNKPMDYLQEINSQEYLLVVQKHILIMQKIATKKITFEDVSSLF